MLEPLGVDEATFAVYHVLLSHPDSTPERIAALVNRSVPEVHELMDNLRKLELLVPTWTNPEAEHAVHPPGRPEQPGRAAAGTAEPPARGAQGGRGLGRGDRRAVQRAADRPEQW